MTADDIIRWARNKGSDAKDVRDAVHEAVHARRAGVTDGWDREATHQALRAKHDDPAMLVREECIARAAEQAACDDLGVEYDAGHWALVAAMESIKGIGISVDYSMWMSAIHACQSVGVREYRGILEEVTKHGDQ